MQANQKLIDAMRDTANKLENSDYQFDHDEYGSCLLGNLTQSSSSYTYNDIKNVMLNDKNVFGYYWESIVEGQVCLVTGIGMNEIYQHLFNLGLTTPEDFIDVEYAGTGDTDYTPSRQEAIDYFRRKADELETRLLSSSVVKIVVTQSVGI